MITNLINSIGANKDQIMQVAFIAAIIVIFYLFSIRPQRKKYSIHKDFIKNLKPGLSIVTIGGIHGSIISVDESTITIETNSKGGMLVIDKNAISIEASSKYQKKENSSESK